MKNRISQRGVIHHSDLGAQYASKDYPDELLKHGFKINMSGKSNQYDSARSSKFYENLEIAKKLTFGIILTFKDTQKRIFYFIDVVYNQKRLPSSLGYLSLDEFKVIFLRKNKILNPVNLV